MIRLFKSQTRLTKRQKVPTVLQFEAVECGAASLSMILRFWGLYLPLGEIRKGCGVNRDGSNLKDISNYAKSLGVAMKGKRMTAKKLISPSDEIYPCIAFWNFCHFVVIEGVSADGRFYIADPAMGHYKVGVDELSKSFSGIILVPQKTDKFQPGGAPENELGGLVGYLKDFKFSIGVAFLLTIVSTVAVITTAGLKGGFVNDFLINARYGLGIPIVWLTFAMLLLTLFTTLTYQLVYRRILLKMMRRLSASIAKKIFCNEYNFYLTRLRGDIAARLMLGTYISQVLVTDLVTSLLSVAGALLILPFLFVMSWQLALASLIYVVFAITMMTYFVSTLREINRSLDYDQAKVDGSSISLISERETIIATSQEHSIISDWLNKYTPVQSKSQTASIRMNFFKFLFSLNKSIYRYGTIVLSGYLVIEGDLNLAGFMAFQAIRGYVVDPLTSLADLSNSLQTAEASLGRLTDLFSVQDDPKVRSLSEVNSINRKGYSSELKQVNVNDSDSVTRPLLTKVEGCSLEANNLILQFGELKKPLINNINFKLGDGDMMTIVGPSGSGKSTLIKLLTGLYDPTSGLIKYSGEDWLNFDDITIRSHIGYVSQEVGGFRGTIQENITIFDNQIPMEDVRHACQLAEIDDIILNLEHGYYTDLGDGGGGLSGGQLQRLEIARAIIKKPKLLFLDEATSSLDIPTERKVLENLRATGATLVCVAHRLLSAEISDYVLVLDQGELSEFGSPGELSSTGGIYSALLSQEER
ncbi:MAG: hypothetical protein CBD29_07895 [Synechococcus sp. TMED169]|nr:MAG: hypothetical protein CBD29_07895 [Synechococcus sp. TMED169]